MSKITYDDQKFVMTATEEYYDAEIDKVVTKIIAGAFIRDDEDFWRVMSMKDDKNLPVGQPSAHVNIIAHNVAYIKGDRAKAKAFIQLFIAD